MKYAAPLILASLFAAAGAHANSSPVGTWHTIDDNTKEVKSEIVITESGGVLSGRVSKLLRKGAKQDAVCEKCSDDRKDKPILGMEIIRGVKKADGKDVWDGGKILDPENGSTYAVRLTLADAGRKLDVRGSIGPFGRTQTWVRVP